MISQLNEVTGMSYLFYRVKLKSIDVHPVVDQAVLLAAISCAVLYQILCLQGVSCGYPILGEHCIGKIFDLCCNEISVFLSSVPSCATLSRTSVSSTL